MKSLQDFKLLTEEEKTDYTKFDALVRAGLANKAQLARLHRILDKMTDERPQFNNADREIMRNLFNKMVDLLANNKQIFQKTRQAVREESDIEAEFKESTQVVEAKVDELDPPFVLMLKRRAIRMYPDGTRVALYYNRQLNKYFSVPYGNTVDPVIQSEEVENVDESLLNMVMGAAKSAGLNAKVAKPAAERKADTMNMLKKRAEDDKKAGIKRPLGGLYSKEYHPRVNKEEVEPVEEAVMDTLHKIVSGNSAQRVKFASGETRKVDHFTASAITQVHKAVNDDNKKKLADMVHKSPAHFEKVAKFAFSKAK